MKIFKTNDIEVYYENGLDGGGTSFGQDYIKIIKKRYNTKFNNCLEWCSGPGFIGFSLLSNKICNNISFLEFYNPCIKYLEITKKNVNLNYLNKIKIYKSNSIKKIPEQQKFDLVVGNPPHFCSDIDFLNFVYVKYNIEHEMNGNCFRLVVDCNWNAHKNFFMYIKKNLSKNGIILLQENIYGSTEKLFSHFIDKHELQITDCFYDTDVNSLSNNKNEIYYLEIKHKKNVIQYY